MIQAINRCVSFGIFPRFFVAVGFGFVFSVFFIESLMAGETALQAPKIDINGKPANVTTQDLSGLISRPLRILVNRNNKARGTEFMKTFAVGARAGDELSVRLIPPAPGVRITVYRILHTPDGVRYLSMPESVYFSEVKTGYYKERIEPFEEEYLILVFEKTDSPDEKNIQIRYFEDRVRNLEITSYKTNLFLSSLKLKMKDFAGGETEKFFERDAQLLVDRFNRPQQIFLIRLWKID